MPDIYFKCDCGKHLAVDEAGIGRQFNCTDCGNPVTIPSPSIEWICPQCGVKIMAHDSLSGIDVQCANCQTTSHLPQKSGKTPRGVSLLCRACQFPMDAQSTVCSKCGLNQVTGELVHTGIALTDDDKPHRPTSNYAGVVVWMLILAIIFGGYFIWRHRQQDVERQSNALSDVMNDTLASTNYADALQTLQMAMTKHLVATNRTNADALVRRIENTILDTDLLAKALGTARGLTNVEDAIQSLEGSRTNHPLAANAAEADLLLAQWRSILAEKDATKQQRIMDSNKLAEVIQRARQMPDMALAIKAIENSVKTCSLATNRNDAEQVIENMRKQRDDTETLAQAIIMANTTAVTNAAKAIENLAAAMNKCVAAFNRSEAERVMKQLRNNTIKAVEDAPAKQAPIIKLQSVKDKIQSVEPTATNNLFLPLNWKNITSSSRVQQDLSRILGQYGKAEVDVNRHDNIVIYQDLTYLMDVKEAFEKLGERVASFTQLNTPYFANRSFKCCIISKIITDGQETFNRIILVADTQNQLVAVQLVNETPKTRHVRGRDQDYSMYNIIQNKTTATPNAHINYKTYFSRKGYQYGRVSDYKGDVLCIESELIARGNQGNEESKEFVRLYLPVPIVNLVLYCLQMQK